MSRSLKHAEATLETLRRTNRQLTISEGVTHAIFLLITIWVSGIVVELLFNLPPDQRVWLLFLLILGSLATIVRLILRVVRNPILKSNFSTQKHWALKLGNFASDKLRDRLLNAIQVNRTNRYGHSDDLAKVALHQVVADMGDIPLDQVIKRNMRQKGLLMRFASQTVVFLLFLAVPTGLSDAMDRLLHPKTAYTQPPSYTISVETEQDWAYRGELTKFRIKVEGEPVSDVEFKYSYDGGDAQSKTVRLKDNSVDLEFEGFSSSIIYHAKYREFSSPEKRLNIVTRPQISELQYRLTPPRYSRLPVEIGAENVGDVEALPGSRFELTIRATKLIGEAYFVFQPTGTDSSAVDSSTLELSGLRGTVEHTMTQGGKYSVRLRDEDNHPNRDPVSYRIRLLTDEYPTVRILFPDEDVILGDDMIVPLQVAADDDFGVSKLQIAFQKLGGENDSAVTTFPLTPDQPGSATILASEMWELGNLTLVPGDVVEYWAIAWDNDNISGPKRSESERRIVRLPTIEEIFAGVEESEQAGFDQAEQALEQARELKDRVAEVIEEMKRNPEADWEQQKQIESAIEQQDELQKQVDQLKQKIDQLVEQLEKHDLLAMETLEKYKQLQELLAEVATPEMKEAMKKLQEAMEKQDPDALRKALEQFDIDREEYLQNIERSLSILKQLQLERKMDELVKQAEELLHRQEEILDGMEDQPADELSKQQQSLANSTENFEQNIEAAKQLAEESGETELADELSDLLKQMDDKKIPTNMRETAQNISSGNMQEAQQQGEQSARDLSELAGQLSNSSQGLKQRRKDNMEKKLRRLTEELLYVSQAQEELAGESIRTGTHSPRYRGLAGRQEDIRNSLNGVTGRLFNVSKETFFVNPSLGAKLGKASEEMGSALKKYSDRNPRSVAKPQSNALGNINQAARQLLEALSEMQGSSSSTGYEEMMEKLSQMAQQQSELNQQSMGMPMPGQGEQQMPGENGMQQLGRMAAEQRMLQEGMKRLSEEGEGMQEILGDLDGIGKSMGEVAGDMEEKNVNQRTRRLQRQIVSRLLDATRSVREEEYSRKRESKTGSDLTRKSPKDLMFDKDKDQLRRDLLRALQEGYTRDYRQLIRAYFRQLEKAEELQKR